VVGGVVVLADLATYEALLGGGLLPSTAKGSGWIVGLILSYLLNSRWTFKELPGGKRRKEGGKRYGSFFFLYILCFLSNVGVNQGVLSLWEGHPHKKLMGFFLATAVSATLNFLGLRFWIFRG
jgi:putative flippase GtrA